MKVDSNLPKIAIVAALEREVHPLVKDWAMTIVEHEGREFTFYESSYAVVVCGGIGAEAARRAAEAIIAKCSPDVVVSAGIAGALVPELHLGETIFPAVVIDPQDGSRHETAIKSAPLANTPLGRTMVVSSSEVAGVAQKQQLAKSYGAQAVDMESAAVARTAMVHALPFVAIKSISDEFDFEMPEMSGFIRAGEFQTGRFALYVALRPGLWPSVYRLARNTRIASENLCAWLRESALTNTIVRSSTTGEETPGLRRD
jgi:adenosylhomocysteine nucleosidase